MLITGVEASWGAGDRKPSTEAKCPFSFTRFKIPEHLSLARNNAIFKKI